MNSPLPGSKIATIMWAPDCPQTEQYSRRFHSSFHKIHYGNLSLAKYVPQSLKTWWVLQRQKPATVHVVNPPIFAPLAVYLYCLTSGASYILDVHGFSITGKWKWSSPILRFLAKNALINIIDQDFHREIFESWGVKFAMLERPPQVPANLQLTRQPDPSRFTVTVVNTFAGDEPLDVLLDAAETLPQIQFDILGNIAKAEQALLDRASDNVSFTGYLFAEDYWNQLNASHAVMTLTAEPYSLVAGGVESMAMGKPCILSRQPALTRYFVKGSVFVEHTPESIAEGLLTTQRDLALLEEEIKVLAAKKQARWEQEFRQLIQLVEEASGKKR